MDEIPVATKCEMVIDNSTKSIYEIQKTSCLEKIKDMLKESKPCCLLNFNNPLESKLLFELEEKGYIIKFTLTYNKSYNCKLTIVNPNVKQTNPEEELTNLISSFLKTGNNDNLSGDLLSNIFKFQG